ncbi:DUF4870 domain-containing protein [Candidatus Poribacteria bacterium]|nr:DUF4870 domain-containing protein [Gammaproteobacteria bacterium]MYF98563.1 DUF4870 domain-containing protein [Candidatus Poribacteria bacterium]
MNETPAVDPPASTSDERTWSILLHISALAGMVFPLGNVLGPFLFWLIKKPESELIDRHGKAALNFQISSTIYFIGMGLLVIILIGLPLIIAYAIFWFIMVIVATIRAADDQDPNYLLSIQFLK